MSYNVQLEDIVRQTGGCGLYQWLLCILVHAGKTIATWSMVTMTFGAQNPGFRCRVDPVLDIGTSENGTTIYDNQCAVNTSKCSSYEFDEHMVTVVSQFSLVCDRKWIAALITTIQMAGVMVGCLVAGQLADMFGRKPVFFVAVFLSIAFNLAGYFSVTWEMYASMRFFIGLGMGFYLTVQYCLMNEFATARWRPLIVNMPSWPVQSALFAMLAWGVHDWKKIHLAIFIVGCPFLFTWWFMPESFRWLVTRRKYAEAENVIKKISKTNRQKMPDLSKIIELAEAESSHEGMQKTYYVRDLFRSRESTKTTIGLVIIWFSASLGYYGITFGVQSLSGDLYLNMFLLSIVEAPVQIINPFLVNWIGRKKTCIIFYALCGVSGTAVGVLQYIHSPVTGTITTVIALAAKMGVALGWQAMILYTTELYPTVIRTLAYGVHSMSARAGGMVAPQIVFLDEVVPGILYFVSGVLMFMSAFIMTIFRETKGQELEDTLGVPLDTLGVAVNRDVNDYKLEDVSCKQTSKSLIKGPNKNDDNSNE